MLPYLFIETIAKITIKDHHLPEKIQKKKLIKLINSYLNFSKIKK